MTCRRFRRCERRDHLLHRIHIMNPTNRSVDIDGSTMSVLDVGSGPAIVLAGSFLWDASMWAPQIAALSDRYRVIVPELWGHGRSGAMPAGTRTMKDLARQHLTLLDALEVGSCAVVGLSVGGMWGAETALMAPARVSSLVLMGTSLAAEPNETRDAYFGMLAAIEQHGTVPAPVQMAAMSLFFSPSIEERQPELPKSFAAVLQAWDPERLRDSVVPLGRIIFGRRNALYELAGLPMATLVATGADDQARPQAEGRAMATRIGCEFVEIPRAGHIASLEAPAVVNELLAGFLERHVTC
jgi:pimeloyl-ACP methyl ester carboxylesterase